MLQEIMRTQLEKKNITGFIETDVGSLDMSQTKYNVGQASTLHSHTNTLLLLLLQALPSHSVWAEWSSLLTNGLKWVVEIKQVEINCPY